MSYRNDIDAIDDDSSVVGLESHHTNNVLKLGKLVKAALSMTLMGFELRFLRS